MLVKNVVQGLALVQQNKKKRDLRVSEKEKVLDEYFSGHVSQNGDLSYWISIQDKLKQQSCMG
jgi:hypothetical protein